LFQVRLTDGDVAMTIDTLAALRATLEDEKAKTARLTAQVRRAYDSGWSLGLEHGECEDTATIAKREAAWNEWMTDEDEECAGSPLAATV
jgi:ribulose bisphosphate carboxylase small subunit